MGETLCRHIFVSGRVQGVFFRESTRRQAQALGLAGWVRNRRDGRVEIRVSGPVDALQSLQNWLQTGPELAKVTNIEVTRCDEDEALPEPFQVIATF